MDQNEEYHDPDYPGTAVAVKDEPKSLSEEDKIEKIKHIIRREFSNEIESRENEVTIIDQRLQTSRRLLYRMRYALVSRYYMDSRLQITSSQIQDEVAVQLEPRARSEVSALLRESQRRLHPSVRKLLGKQTADIDEIFKSREPRNKIRKNYSAMLHRNYTIAADTTKSLRPDIKTEEEEPCTSKPKKVPRLIYPKIENVLTLDELTRNKVKHRYRIIIGNTSKYAPAASRADRSTHKWLLYVRGPQSHSPSPSHSNSPPAPGVESVLTAVTVRLHHSYAPHHTVHIHKPPFQLSRRGWGEFPAKVELFFALPERNRPAIIEHTIKLDRNYTGLQTLGAETVVDVWLYSTQEMLEFEFKDDEIEQPKTETPEPEQNTESQTENWLDFFSKDTTELDVDEMLVKEVKKEFVDTKDVETLIHSSVIDKKLTELNNEQSDHEDIKIKSDWAIMSDKDIENPSENIPNEILCQPTSPKKRIMKYIDPTTGKIYYLELDRNLDLSKVQEIVINSKGNVKTAKISPIKTNGVKNVRKTKKGVSLLKPEVKDLIKSEINKEKIRKNYTHIENDHCYLGSDWAKSISFSAKNDIVKTEYSLYECLCKSITRIPSVKPAVNYLLKKIPIISDQARDVDYLKYFPFTVENDEKYWKMDFAKRRNIEWSRAKLINKILTEHFTNKSESIWRTKQILIYSRLHGFFPIRQDVIKKTTEESEWSSWNDLERPSNIREFYPNASDICSLTLFNPDEFKTSLSESVSLIESDEEIEVVNSGSPIRVKKEVVSESSDRLEVLPVESEEDRLRFFYVERKCADIGIELKNEDIGHGYSYSAVHAVLVSAVRSAAEELVRGALAHTRGVGGAGGAGGAPLWGRSCPADSEVSLRHVYAAVTGATRLRAALDTPAARPAPAHRDAF